MEKELLAKCRSGDAQAIETLVNEYQARVYRWCLSILDDPEDAQDATQDSFLAALKGLDSYRGDSAFQTWLFSIALNICRGQLRKHKRQRNLTDTLADPVMMDETHKPGPEKQAADNERRQAIWQVVNDLDEKHRLPVILRYYHDMSTQEIAEVLQVNVGTVHSRLSIARTRLSGELKRANITLSQGGAQ